MKKLTAILLFCLIILFCACGKSGGEEQIAEETAATTSAAEQTEEETVTATSVQTTAATTVTAAAATQAATQAAAQTYPYVTTEGSDSIFTTDPENKFIKTISETCDVDPSFLAALYTESSDSNYIWQFDGTTDENGKPVRTSDTLVYVYALDQDCTNLQRTDGENDFTNCSKLNGMIAFESAKQLLIPKYQEYL